MSSIQRRPARALPLAAALSLWSGSLHAVAAEPPIRLNTLGYLPKAAKHATIAAEGGNLFRVLRMSDGQAVLEGKLSASVVDGDTSETVATADFSALRDSGEFRLQIDGVGDSMPFRIDADLYREPFGAVVRGIYLWRCGTAVSAEHNGQTFAHAACHLDDAYLDFVGGGHERRTSVGGWHDAGDYNKYVVNAGVTVGVMFRAWEDFGARIERIPLGLPEAGRPLPEYLAELKWELDWLLTMQADDGSVYHKVSTKQFGGMILPEKEGAERFFVPSGTNATADFVAMLAMASRHFARYDRDYADRCLQAARKSYDYLVAHPDYARANQRGFGTGTYETDDWDDRLWAEAEMWEATGDPAALAALESRLRTASAPIPAEENATGEAGRPRGRRRGRSAAVDVDWDWGNVKNLGLLTYLASQREGRDSELAASVKASLIAAADEIVATSQKHAYARPLGSRYSWGCNGAVARQTLVLESASRLTGNESYRAVGLDAVNHLLGRNPYGRSYITGVGQLPPLHPHDRRSAGDSVADPWPGYLVGGPQPRATSWRDDQDDYRTNEIAINWNAALIYALAAQLGE